MLRKPTARCKRNITAGTELAKAVAKDENCVDDDPANIVRLGIRNGAIDDTTAHAIIASQKRGVWFKKNQIEFESFNALRWLRLPRGKGVPIEAFGIRWIPETCERTLLTGAKLSEVFPNLMHTERVSQPRMILIGRVTIPPGWDEGEDYLVVERPLTVNSAPDAPAEGDHTNHARYIRGVIQNRGWPHMDLDPNRKVIIPSCDPAKPNQIMRLQDVPAFRIQCANPIMVSDAGNQRYDSNDAILDDGLWSILVDTPWTTGSTDARPSKVQYVESEPTETTESTSAAESATPADKNEAAQSAEPPFDILPPSPERPRDSHPPVGDIYQIVAKQVDTPVVDRRGTWQPLDEITGHVHSAFARETALLITGECSKVMGDVAQAAGKINKYCKENDWSQEAGRTQNRERSRIRSFGRGLRERVSHL
jgi:hypothetical protein